MKLNGIIKHIRAKNNVKTWTNKKKLLSWLTNLHFRKIHLLHRNNAQRSRPIDGK